MKTQEKKGSKKAAALGLGLALALTVGMTSAYLADSSELITNEFDPEWVFTDVEESGDQQYDIVPGTEETKDPKVKVNNSVDAYVYLIVTDKVNKDGQVVDYTIDPMWKEIPKSELSGKTLTKADGSPFELGEYDTIYYAVAPKTADGETSEVRGEDDDDFELIYPVLVGDKVSYPSSLTNSDLEGIEDPDNILSFWSYAIQKDPFDNEIDALQPIPASKRIAKKAIEDAVCDDPSTDETAAATTAKNAIDEATSLDAIDAAKEEGLKAIAEAHEAHQSEVTMPQVGDIVKLGNLDKRFYVTKTKVNGVETQIEVLDQEATPMAFDENGDQATFNDGSSYLAYKDSDIDDYLENTYYPALQQSDANVYSKIQKKDIKQSAYDRDFNRIAETTVGERHVYLLDMDDVVNLTDDERAAMFPDGFWSWLRSATTRGSYYALGVFGIDGRLVSGYNDDGLGACAAFTINLNGLDFEIL